MADKRISGLPALSFSTKEDILMVVNDPAGTPSNKKISVENFFSNVEPKIFRSNSFSLDLSFAVENTFDRIFFNL